MGFTSILTAIKLVAALGVAAVIGFFVWKYEHMQGQIQVDKAVISQQVGNIKFLNNEVAELKTNEAKEAALSNQYEQTIQTSDQSFSTVIDDFDNANLNTNVISLPDKSEDVINQQFNDLMDCISISTGSKNAKPCNFDRRPNSN